MKSVVSLVVVLFLALMSAASFAAEPAQQPQGEKPRTVEEVYPAVAVGLPRDAELKEMKPEIIATINDFHLTRDYIESKIGDVPDEDKQLFEKNQPFLVAQFVQSHILLMEARREGLVKEKADEKAQNEAIQKMVQDKVGEAEVTDDDVQQAYEKYKDQLGDTKFEDAKPLIRQALLQQKQQEIFMKFMNDISKDVKVAVNKDWAQQQNTILTNNPVDKARQSGKVTMAEFGAEWCPPCREMAPVIKQLKDELKDNVNIIPVDVDKEKALAMRYSVRNLPTQVYFNAKGEEVSRHEGMCSKEDILKKLDEIKAGDKASAPDKK